MTIRIVTTVFSAVLLFLFSFDALAEEQINTDVADTAEVSEEISQDEQKAITANNFSNGIEWVGINIGATLMMSLDHESGFTDMTFAKADLLLFTLRRDRFYMTLLELHVLPTLGPLGLGIRMGHRCPLTANYAHEIRIGAMISFDFLPSRNMDFAKTLSFAPHLQYIFNTKHISLGLGLDLIFTTSLEGDSSRYEKNSGTLIGPALYIRGSFASMF